MWRVKTCNQNQVCLLKWVMNMIWCWCAFFGVMSVAFECGIRMIGAFILHRPPTFMLCIAVNLLFMKLNTIFAACFELPRVYPNHFSDLFLIVCISAKILILYVCLNMPNAFYAKHKHAQSYLGMLISSWSKLNYLKYTRNILNTCLGKYQKSLHIWLSVMLTRYILS